MTSGLMSRLLSELDADDDILTQLNCLELLSVLVTVGHGRQYLQQSGTLERLEDKLVNMSDDPLAELLLPGQSVCEIGFLAFMAERPYSPPAWLQHSSSHMVCLESFLPM